MQLKTCVTACIDAANFRLHTDVCVNGSRMHIRAFSTCGFQKHIKNPANFFVGRAMKNMFLEPKSAKSPNMHSTNGHSFYHFNFTECIVKCANPINGAASVGIDKTSQLLSQFKSYGHRVNHIVGNYLIIVNVNNISLNFCTQVMLYSQPKHL